MSVKIVVHHDDTGRWWWDLLGETGQILAVSAPLASRTDCARSIAELKVEGPYAEIAYEDVAQAAKPGTWTISSLIPSGS